MQHNIMRNEDADAQNQHKKDLVWRERREERSERSDMRKRERETQSERDRGERGEIHLRAFPSGIIRESWYSTKNISRPRGQG